MFPWDSGECIGRARDGYKHKRTRRRVAENSSLPREPRTSALAAQPDDTRSFIIFSFFFVLHLVYSRSVAAGGKTFIYHIYP